MPGTLGLPLRAAALAVLVALPLVLVGPPGGDEPAHLYRTELVREGVLVWDTFWFAGHYPLASYSLLYYFPAALVGNTVAAVAAIAAAALLFAAVVEDEWGGPAAPAALAFAVVAAGPLFTGTYPYAAGLAALLACLRSLQLGRRGLAALFVVLTVGFSPLAFLFLCLALLAVAAVRRPSLAEVAPLAAAAGLGGAAQALALAIFPHDATYPFFRSLELGAVLVAAGLALALAARSPRGRLLAAFLALWVATAVLAYLVPSPVGENVTRLRGVVLPLALLAAALAGWRPRALVVPAVAAALAYTLTPYVGAALHRGDGRPAGEEFWAPALALLGEHASPEHRVEVVPTGDHWEAYWLPRAGFPLARGWYRQLDYAENPLFYGQRLDAEAYRAWLRRLGVRHVLLPPTQLGRAGEEREADLLRSGGSGLVELPGRDGWRFWELPDAATILPGGTVTAHEHDRLAGTLPAAGRYRLAVRFTPYWRLAAGDLCVAEAPDGMTEIRAARAGPFELAAAVGARGSTVCRR